MKKLWKCPLCGKHLLPIDIRNTGINTDGLPEDIAVRIETHHEDVDTKILHYLCSNHYYSNNNDGWKYFLRVETSDEIEIWVWDEETYYDSWRFLKAETKKISLIFT